MDFVSSTVTPEKTAGQKRLREQFPIVFRRSGHDFFQHARKNISTVLSFAHKSGKPCGKRRKISINPPNFNAMMRFAPFLCNRLHALKFF
jgi:hypothetical protein